MFHQSDSKQQQNRKKYLTSNNFIVAVYFCHSLHLQIHIYSYKILLPSKIILMSNPGGSEISSILSQVYFLDTDPGQNITDRQYHSFSSYFLNSSHYIILTIPCLYCKYACKVQTL
jgi:hypothetical protein